MTYKLFLVLIGFLVILFSCSNKEIKLYNLENEPISINKINQEYLILTNSYSCKDCVKDLIERLNKLEKKYILIFPIENYNNLTKGIISNMYIDLGVNEHNIYWIDKIIYEQKFKEENTPFLLINHKEMEIMPYQEIFDNKGKVKPGVIT